MKGSKGPKEEVRELSLESIKPGDALPARSRIDPREPPAQSRRTEKSDRSQMKEAFKAPELEWQ